MNTPDVLTAQGKKLEVRNILVFSLMTPPQVDNVKKLWLKLGSFFMLKSCFSFEVWKRLVSAMFLPVLDYGDLLYMNASAHCCTCYILHIIVH